MPPSVIMQPPLVRWWARAACPALMHGRPVEDDCLPGSGWPVVLGAVVLPARAHDEAGHERADASDPEVSHQEWNQDKIGWVQIVQQLWRRWLETDGWHDWIKGKVVAVISLCYSRLSQQSKQIPTV